MLDPSPARLKFVITLVSAALALSFLGVLAYDVFRDGFPPPVAQPPPPPPFHNGTQTWLQRHPLRQRPDSRETTGSRHVHRDTGGGGGATSAGRLKHVNRKGASKTGTGRGIKLKGKRKGAQTQGTSPMEEALPPPPPRQVVTEKASYTHAKTSDATAPIPAASKRGKGSGGRTVEFGTERNSASVHRKARSKRAPRSQSAEIVDAAPH